MFYRKHSRVSPTTGQHSMTKQSMAQQCDINYILNQYQRTGMISHINSMQPSFEELPSDFDYQSSLNVLQQADNTFSQLPAKIRDHFGNSPLRFLEAFNDPTQEATLRGFGLFQAASLPDKPQDPLAPPTGAA